MSNNEIKLSIGDFETIQVKPWGVITSMDDDALQGLLQRGWELVSRKQAQGRTVVVLRRPGK